MVLVAPAEDLDLIDAVDGVGGGEHILVRGQAPQGLLLTQLHRGVAEVLFHVCPPLIPVALGLSLREAIGKGVLMGGQHGGALLLVLGGIADDEIQHVVGCAAALAGAAADLKDIRVGHALPGGERFSGVVQGLPVGAALFVVGSQSQPRQKLEAQHKDERECADTAQKTETPACILPHLFTLL